MFQLFELLDPDPTQPEESPVNKIFTCDKK